MKCMLFFSLLLKRSLSFLFDIVIFVLVVLLIDAINTIFSLIQIEAISIIAIAIALLYFPYMEYRFGYTWGRYLFGLKVNCRDNDSSVHLKRFLLVSLSAYLVVDFISIIIVYFAINKSTVNYFVTSLFLSIPTSYLIITLLNGGVSIIDIITRTTVSSKSYIPSSNFDFRTLVIGTLFSMLMVSALSIIFIGKLVDMDNKGFKKRNEQAINELNEYIVNPVVFASKIPNANLYIEEDWSKENFFIETGKCMNFSSLSFQDSPFYTENAFANVRELGCLNIEIPVSSTSLFKSSHEYILKETLKNSLPNRQRLIILTMFKEWKGRFLMVDLKKRVLIPTSSDSLSASLETTFSIDIGFGLYNDPIYMTEFYNF